MSKKKKKTLSQFHEDRETLRLSSVSVILLTEMNSKPFS